MDVPVLPGRVLNCSIWLLPSTLAGLAHVRVCLRVRHCLLVRVIRTRIVHPVTAHRGRGQLRAMALG